jgi:parvulin-like peptidyl-prolyl isomerase
LIRLTQVVLFVLACGCNPRSASGPDAGPPPPGGLTAEQARQVLARVGSRTITLGDYAATLERMDPFDRLRYQAPERQKELLEEMIDVELLAEDARKKHLDQKPETQLAIRQILRDALLAQARSGLPVPEDLAADEVRTYYESHREEFTEPERRRAAHILVKDRETAQRVLALAKKATGAQWGELHRKYSLDAPRKGSPEAPLELLGDLGIVGAPGDPRGDNARVPAAVRIAVFELASVGDVSDKLAEDAQGYHVVKMTGKSDPRARSLAEAERTIRVSIVQTKIAERERALEQELRKEFPVVLDEGALAAVAVPRPGPDAGL